MMKLQMPIMPPFRFATVEIESDQAGNCSYGLYRSAYPSLKNFRFLQRLKLRTILSLVPAEPVRDLTEFCDRNDIKNVHVRIDKFSDEVTFTASVMTQVLETVIDANNHPML
eukprot:SAG31_NODE_19218_length_609_cov_0.858824_1_plen_111_part_10